MIKSEIDGVYLITHSYGEVIDGITWDESSAKFLVDKLNERYKKVDKCFKCRKSNFEIGKKICDKSEIYFSGNGRGSRCAIYCINDVTDKLNKDYIECPNEYYYQKIDVIDVEKMLGEDTYGY